MKPDPTSLDLLHDLVAPPAAPWWPPAPGWDFVLGALAVALLVMAVRAIIRWQHNRYRREALAEWKRQAERLHTPGERASALAALCELLKRAALTAFPRREVASLHSSEWLAFLDRTAGTNAFSNAEGAALERAAYDPRTAAGLSDAQAAQIAQLVHRWIACHRRDADTRTQKEVPC